MTLSWCALAMAAAWLEREAPERHSHAGHHAVLGHGDPSLANFSRDGGQIRLVDFEDSGPRTESGRQATGRPPA